MIIESLCMEGCENKELINNSKQGLIGSWEWIATYKDYYLSESNPQTPQNTGTIEILAFNSDSTWSRIINNIKTDSGSFSTGHGSYLGNTYVYDSICYFQKKIASGVDYFKLKNDTLTFSRDFAGTTGGGSKLWIRKK